jgi:hypothetical protein
MTARQPAATESNSSGLPILAVVFFLSLVVFHLGNAAAGK